MTDTKHSPLLTDAEKVEVAVAALVALLLIRSSKGDPEAAAWTAANTACQAAMDAMPRLFADHAALKAERDTAAANAQEWALDAARLKAERDEAVALLREIQPYMGAVKGAPLGRWTAIKATTNALLARLEDRK